MARIRREETLDAGWAAPTEAFTFDLCLLPFDFCLLPFFLLLLEQLALRRPQLPDLRADLHGLDLPKPIIR